MLDDMSQLTVSKLAGRAGTSADTVRYYERIGLLPVTDRSPSGYRLYGGDAVDRLRFIKRAQRFGLRLGAIAEVLEIRERGLCPCGHTRELLERRLLEIDEEMAALSRLRDDIHTMIEGFSQRPPDDWGCAADLTPIPSTARCDETELINEEKDP